LAQKSASIKVRIDAALHRQPWLGSYSDWEKVMTAIVDQEKCEGCEECVSVCPTDAIAITDGKAIIDESTCADCAACVDACPTEAITC
jgi:ferredoxin